MDYKQKYIKYKNKYLKIKKNQIGGGEDETYLYYDGKQIRGKLFERVYVFYPKFILSAYNVGAS